LAVAIAGNDEHEEDDDFIGGTLQIAPFGVFALASG